MDSQGKVGEFPTVAGDINIYFSETDQAEIIFF